MRTFVYVDGFNLYYGALKGTPFKWLDPVALLNKILQPRHDIVKLKYFTARVSGTPADQSKPQRQDVYLRALQRYRPEIEVYFGHFLRHRVRAPLARPAGPQRTVEVIKTEEKGSAPVPGARRRDGGAHAGGELDVEDRARDRVARRLGYHAAGAHAGVACGP